MHADANSDGELQYAEFINWLWGEDKFFNDKDHLFMKSEVMDHVNAFKEKIATGL